jgi:hypothetical protein
MGVIDKKTYTLSCENCGANESASILDKGSGWSGSSWQASANFIEFKTEWSQSGEKVEPSLIHAICNNCGTVAKDESRYSS